MSLFETLAKIGEIVDPILDLLVLFGLFHKDPNNPDPNAKPVPNPNAIPTFAKRHEDIAIYGRLNAQISAGEQNALNLHWLPSLHPVQNDHFTINVARMAVSNDPTKVAACEAAAVALLKRIAALPDNDLRTKEADALNLILNPATRYKQVMLEEWAGRRFTDLKDLANWINDHRFNLIEKWLNHPADPATNDAGGVLQRMTKARDDMKAKADRKSKRWI